MTGARGVAFGGDYAALPAFARRAEAVGFDALWLSETARDSTVQAAVAAQATERITIGTSVTLAFARSPTLAALQAWDLAELSSSRFVLGLGSQVRRIVEDRFSAAFDPPAARMAEYLAAVRTVWGMERGEASGFEGAHYRVVRAGLHGPGTTPGRRPPAVYLAAVGPRMTRVATAGADGLLGHPFTSARHLKDTVLPRVERGLVEAGRPREDFRVCQSLIVSVAEDAALAVREAKQQIAFYGSTPNYRGVLDAHGDGHLQRRFRAALARGRRDPAALAAAVPDEAVARYAAAGTPDEVAEQVAAFDGLADHVILGGPWFGVPPARVEENLAAVLDTLA